MVTFIDNEENTSEVETACHKWGGSAFIKSLGGYLTFILNTSDIGYYALHDNLQFWGGSAPPLSKSGLQQIYHRSQSWTLLPRSSQSIQIYLEYDY